MRILVLAATSLLLGCGSSHDAGNNGDDAASSLASDLQKPMDDAAAVEQQLMEQKQRVDAALDEADGDTPRQR